MQSGDIPGVKRDSVNGDAGASSNGGGADRRGGAEERGGAEARGAVAARGREELARGARFLADVAVFFFAGIKLLLWRHRRLVPCARTRC